ncbi:glutamate receptor U1-like [Dermacentor variabilis]|uniref:glutamate receptor U1-like n=1 Tax=Dermacentor variabilis TaxID=34621 RepID=UPI003F5C7764
MPLVSQWPPYSIFVKDEHGQDKFWGISGALIGNLTESMGLRIVFKIPVDNQWGYRMANGSWAGMLGDLSRNESDIAAGPFVLTASTAATFPNGFSYLVETFNFLCGIEHPFTTQIFTKISTFDIQMWIMMFLCMILLAYISLHLLYVKNGNGRALGYLERSNEWTDMFFLYFSGLMQRATSHREGCNKSAPFRGLLWLWLVCSFFVMNFFTANMSASLMVKTEAPRIRTVEDVLRVPDKRVLLFADSGFTDLFMYSELESYRDLYSQIRRTGGEIHPTEVFAENNMRQVLKQNSVILQEKLTLDDQVGRQCRRLVGQGYFYFSEQSLSTLPISWYARADLDPLIRDELYTRLMWYVDTGLLAKLREETSPLGEECLLRMSDKSDLEHRTLLLDDLQPMFLLALLLLQFATVVFLAELLFAAVSKRRQGTPHHRLFVDGRRVLQDRRAR